MRTRKGKFAITVTESDKWINFADLSNDENGEILKSVIDEAKEHANREKEWVCVYISELEYEIRPEQ
jgi:hypothetical protein